MRLNTLGLALLLISCVSHTAETTSEEDSVTVIDEPEKTGSVSGATDAPTEYASATLSADVPDSLKDNPLAIYHAEYMLASSSAAEQARMQVRFVGNNTFDFHIDYQVADFCDNSASGSFTIEGNTGNYAFGGDERVLTFSFADGNINVSDPNGQLGVGTCSFSGDFRRCDGKCPEISWNGFGDEGVEGDSVEL